MQYLYCVYIGVRKLLWSFYMLKIVYILYTASSPPLIPMLRSVVITPYSANISWVVTSIVYDNETYSVQYGMDMMALQNTSQDVMGNSYQFAINDVFSVNIMGLTPFTIYYYIIWANNSLGNTSTATTSFTSGEIGNYVTYNQMFVLNVLLMIICSTHSSSQ